MKITEAREQIGRVYTRVAAGDLEVVERNHERDVVLVNAHELGGILEEKAPFRLELRFGEDHVAAWVQGLPVHAEESSLGEALDEIAEGLVAYAEVWREQLSHAPNHAGNRDHVRRIQLAGSAERVREMLDRDAEKEQAQYSGSEQALATQA